jgi:hypothetical protein
MNPEHLYNIGRYNVCIIVITRNENIMHMLALVRIFPGGGRRRIFPIM